MKKSQDFYVVLVHDRLLTDCSFISESLQKLKENNLIEKRQQLESDYAVWNPNKSKRDLVNNRSKLKKYNEVLDSFSLLDPDLVTYVKLSKFELYKKQWLSWVSYSIALIIFSITVFLFIDIAEDNKSQKEFFNAELFESDNSVVKKDTELLDLKIQNEEISDLLAKCKRQLNTCQPKADLASP